MLNVLTAGSSFLGMLQAGPCHLSPPRRLRAALAGWAILAESLDRFPAPDETGKVFDTEIARRP